MCPIVRSRRWSYLHNGGAGPMISMAGHSIERSHHIAFFL